MANVRRVLEIVTPIETERLRLRPFVAEDLDAITPMQASTDVTRYLYWGPRTREEARAALELNAGRTVLHEEGDILSLAVVLRDGGELVGDVVFFLRSVQHRQGEIGFIFDPRHQGNGYATEAARVLLRLGFHDLDLHRIFGRLDARNGASARVLERLGMRREAHLVENEMVKGEWTDELVYALLRREWERGGVAPSV